MLNPALAGRNAKIQVLAGYRMLTNLFDGVNTSYAGVHLTPWKADSTRIGKHGLGMYLHNQREGLYFNRGRMMAQYAYHLQVNARWCLSSGISAGIINHSFRATDLLPARSLARPNLDVGISFLNNDFLQFGFVVGQLLPSSMEPLEPERNIHPYWQSHAHAVLARNSRIQWWFHALTRKTNRDPQELVLSSLLEINKTLSVGGYYSLKRGYGLSAGMYAHTSAHTAFELMASWYVPSLLQSGLTVQQLEFSCNFFYR
jgi:hypothetical protein